jgi:hypothetical protein
VYTPEALTTHGIKISSLKEQLLKTKRFTQLAAILTLCIFALAGCKSGGNNNNNTGNANNTNATSNTAADKNTPATTASKGDYSTPSAAVKTFYAAAKRNDLEGVKRSMSKKTMEMLEKSAAVDKKSVNEVLRDSLKDAVPANDPEIRNEQITGDSATLDVKDDKMNDWESISLVKENGEWKIAQLDKMADAAKELEKLDTGKK